MNWTIEYEWLVYVNKLPFDAIAGLFMKALKFEMKCSRLHIAITNVERVNRVNDLLDWIRNRNEMKTMKKKNQIKKPTIEQQ